jgi:hypothetical protein
MPKEKADPRGRKKGTPKTGGRQKGTPNKVTALLKEAIIMAAEKCGRDTKGAGGVVGYCEFLAQEHPQTFATLLGKVLPLQLTGGSDGDTPLKFTLQLDEGKE